jgi:hypothetical protein
MALLTMYNFFSMGWAVTLACIQGLIQPKGVFLRTPKAKSSSKFLRALRVTQWETLIGLVCIITGTVAFIVNPNARTFFLFSLLIWQSSLYLSAPFFSLLSTEGVEVPAHRSKEQGAGILEQWAARWAVALTAVILLVGAAVQLLPQPAQPPSYAVYQPEEVPPERLLGIEQIPIEERATPPTPRPTSTDQATPTLEPTSTIAATSTAVVTATPTEAAATVTPSVTPTAVPSATSAPTSTGTTPPSATPGASSTPQPSGTPTLGGSSTPAATQTGTIAPPIGTVTPPNSTTPAITPSSVPTGTPIPAAVSLDWDLRNLETAANLQLADLFGIWK